MAADFTGIIKTIKRAAEDAGNASNPVSVTFGSVLSVSPLKINVEQKMTLESAQLILTRNVTDYTVDMSVNHETEIAEGHLHDYVGRKTFTVYNALKLGEKVILLRLQGGQKYIVIDRLG